MNNWKRWLPGLQILSRYEASWLPRDLMAGLVLTTLLVPVGIAYAVASGDVRDGMVGGKARVLGRR
jgi:MFS superfamily sulfate permease-like transporter